MQDYCLHFLQDKTQVCSRRTRKPFRTKSSIHRSESDLNGLLVICQIDNTSRGGGGGGAGGKYHK